MPRDYDLGGEASVQMASLRNGDKQLDVPWPGCDGRPAGHQTQLLQQLPLRLLDSHWPQLRQLRLQLQLEKTQSREKLGSELS